jgi:GTPase SAR1 family protein
MTFGIIIISIIVLGFGGGIFVWRIIRKQKFMRLLDMQLLSVQVSQHVEEPDRNHDPLSEVNKFAQLLSGLASPKISFVFEVSVHNVGDNISFYFAAPKKTVELISRQIQGLWPGAQVAPVEDYTIFNSEGAIKTAYLKQKQATHLPIRTYADAKLDTFSTVLSNFSKLQTTGEGLTLQVLAHPAFKEEKSKILNTITKLKRGAKMDVKGRVGDPPKREEGNKKDALQQPLVVDEESVKLLEQKVTRPLFYVDVRLLASAATEMQASDLLDGLAASFAQFTAPRHNEFKLITSKNPRKMAFDYSFRQFKPEQKMLLNADEIASFLHFPTGTTSEIPKVNWTRGKQVHPPLTLAKEGTLIGESAFRGEAKEVMISDEDRRRHVYVIGQTGTGKTSLLQNMIRSDIERGKGVAVIDPHGDLINATLGIIPETRLADVIVFDPGDIARPLGLNMIENDPKRPEEKTFIVNEMQSIFNKLFSQETMGPMFEQYMRNALQLLMEDKEDPATLMEVPRVFTDAEFRKRKLARARNPAVIDFWEKEAVKVGGEASLQNMTPYITSKFNNFIANDYVRPIIGQQKSAFNFRGAMDEGKIILVNLSKGKIGEINAGLLGMVLVGKILMAALSRVDMSESERKDFNLYIDEFQNFTTDSISTILSEARKYRLNLVIAHQFIAQLEDDIRDSVFGNVGSMISFRVGAEDAEVLVKQFEPVFEKNDLINIDNFNAYIRLLINGQTAAPFNIKTIRPKEGDTQLAFRLKEYSRTTYGKDSGEIEKDILNRLRS